MNEKTKLIFALMQIENISNLVEGNAFEKFMVSHLLPLKIEMERQLTNLSHSDNIKE